MKTDEPFTYSAGDLVRVAGWRNQLFVVKRINLVKGTCDLWGGPPHRASLRTVDSTRIMPPGPRDHLRAPREWANK